MSLAKVFPDTRKLKLSEDTLNELIEKCPDPSAEYKRCLR